MEEIRLELRTHENQSVGETDENEGGDAMERVEGEERRIFAGCFSRVKCNSDLGEIHPGKLEAGHRRAGVQTTAVKNVLMLRALTTILASCVIGESTPDFL